MPIGSETEQLLLLATCAIYLGASLTWLVALAVRRLPPPFFLPLVAVGLVPHTLLLAVRWYRLGHGPFVTLHEILLSNVWSLTLITALCYWRLRSFRPAFLAAVLVLQLLSVWLWTVPAADSHLPPTYETPWLIGHVAAGKVFLGLLLVAVNLSVAVLIRETRAGALLLGVSGPGVRELDQLAYRFTAAALVFESLMLLFGAIWAQDAWGRYWSWDPLETWSFIAWLMVVFALHLRSYGGGRLRAWVACVVIVAFAVAFVTFFGVPFLSAAPHQGVV